MWLVDFGSSLNRSTKNVLLYNLSPNLMILLFTFSTSLSYLIFSCSIFSFRSLFSLVSFSCLSSTLSSSSTQILFGGRDTILPTELFLVVRSVAMFGAVDLGRMVGMLFMYVFLPPAKCAQQSRCEDDGVKFCRLIMFSHFFLRS